ncbi:MAG TPA: HEAT repeat domain-containing protein [Candidatus Acidoferrales bacterium]|nr:HEAT repeat domain-containing protein [Candidatus Acidoferrales bacterium]
MFVKICRRLSAALVLLMVPTASNSRPSPNVQASPSAGVAPQAAQQKAPAPNVDGQKSSNQAPADIKSPPATAIQPIANLPDAAWALLRQGAASDKFQDRSDALSALTILDSDRRALSLIENGLSDKEESIRVLAAASLGVVKARSAIPKLKAALDDTSPQVSFAAAQSLWKMGDRSGRDIFYEILNGERKTTPGVIQGKINQARRDMRDPKALALIGINEASGALLGPFSMGVSLVEEYAKGNGATVQSLCAQLLASDHSHRTAEELTDALGDKNWPVRAAAARSLAQLRYARAIPQLKDMMEDDKSRPARFAAAAAIVRLSRDFRKAASLQRSSGLRYAQPGN